jgi:hypothetical protein
MNSGGGVSLIWLEIVLGFGVPVAWGLWELHTLRQLRRRDEARARAEAAAPPPLRPDAASGTAASPAPTDGQSA